MENSHSASYAAAGVDVTAGYESVRRIKPMVESTYIPGVMGTLGGFGGLFAPDTAGMEKPVLVSGTDGVGTKLKIAMLLDKHDTVGIDCVAMCVNDIVCSGARPLFFLDYLAVGKNRPEHIAQVVSGITEGCRQAGCALVGGETAEHPGMMAEDDYDMAGFAVGLVDEPKMLTGRGMTAGDVLVGLASSGVHSNGFSLVRKVFRVNEAVLSSRPEGLECTLGEELIRPTRIYVKSLLALLDKGFTVRAVSHITGGGLYENIPRMMAPGLTARVEKASFPVLPVFKLIQEVGNIPERDMYNTFNMGLGMVIALPKAEADGAVALLRELGEVPYIVGEVVSGDSGVELV